VPWIDVKLYDSRVTEESVPKIIEALTNALADSSGAAPEHIQVVVEGFSPKHWGIAGKPCTRDVLEQAPAPRLELCCRDQPCTWPAIPQCFGLTPCTITWMCSGEAPDDSAKAFVSASMIFGTDSSVTRLS